MSLSDSSALCQPESGTSSMRLFKLVWGKQCCSTSSESIFEYRNKL